jgi:hypothetical protein
MATGFTAPIEDDPDFTFEQYLWRCARGMGPLASMREAPLDAEIPERLTVSNAYAADLREARAAVQKLARMSEEEAEAESVAEHDKYLREDAKLRATRVEEGARYRAMQDKVNAWTPPTPEHEHLKQFMLNQLAEGHIDFRLPDPAPRKKGPAWREERIRFLREHIDRMEARQAENAAWTEFANRWLADLRKSVPQPAPQPKVRDLAECEPGKALTREQMASLQVFEQ